MSQISINIHTCESFNIYYNAIQHLIDEGLAYKMKAEDRFEPDVEEYIEEAIQNIFKNRPKLSIDSKIYKDYIMQDNHIFDGWNLLYVNDDDITQSIVCNIYNYKDTLTVFIADKNGRNREMYIMHFREDGKRRTKLIIGRNDTYGENEN